MERTTDDLLKIPISSLELSDEFKEMARTNHFSTLAEMVELRVETLQEMPLFNYRMLAEYVSFLTKHGLDGLIED